MNTDKIYAEQLINEYAPKDTVTNLIGVNIDKRFIPSVADIIGTDPR